MYLLDSQGADYSTLVAAAGRAMGISTDGSTLTLTTWER